MSQERPVYQIINEFTKKSSKFRRIKAFFNKRTKEELNFLNFREFYHSRFNLDTKYYFDETKTVDDIFNDPNSYLLFYGSNIPLGIFKNTIDKNSIDEALNYIKNKLDYAYHASLNFNYKLYDYFNREININDFIFVIDEHRNIEYGQFIRLHLCYEKEIMVKIDNELKSFCIINFPKLTRVIKSDKHLEALQTFKKLTE